MRRLLLPSLCLVAATADPATAAGTAWRWPVHGRVVTRFRVSPATPYAAGQHRGIDIAARVGSPVRAACAGRVRFAGTLPDGTGAVSVVCGDVTATYLQVRGFAVRRGARIAAGAVLASVAPSRDAREPAPHLYLGARVDSGGRPRYRDPLALLSSRGPRPLVPFRPTPIRRRRTPQPPGTALPPLPLVAPPAVQPGAPQAPTRVPPLAWIGVGLTAIALPVGAVVRRRRRAHRPATQVFREAS